MGWKWKGRRKGSLNAVSFRLATFQAVFVRQLVVNYPVPSGHACILETNFSHHVCSHYLSGCNLSKKLLFALCMIGTINSTGREIRWLTCKRPEPSDTHLRDNHSFSSYHWRCSAHRNNHINHSKTICLGRLTLQGEPVGCLGPSLPACGLCGGSQLLADGVSYMQCSLPSRMLEVALASLQNTAARCTASSGPDRASSHFVTESAGK